MFFLMMIIMFLCGGMFAAVSDGAQTTYEMPSFRGLRPQVDAAIEQMQKAKQSLRRGYHWHSFVKNSPVVYGFLAKSVFQNVQTLMDDGEREEFKKAALGFVDNVLIRINHFSLARDIQKNFKRCFDIIHEEIGALKEESEDEIMDTLLKHPSLRALINLGATLQLLKEVEEETIDWFFGISFPTQKAHLFDKLMAANGWMAASCQMIVLQNEK